MSDQNKNQPDSASKYQVNVHPGAHIDQFVQGEDNLIVHGGGPDPQTLQFIQAVFSQTLAQAKNHELSAALVPTLTEAKAAIVDAVSHPADEQKQHKAVGLLRSVRAMAGDIGQVIVTTLASPPVGVALVIKKIADKALAQAGADEKAD